MALRLGAGARAGPAHRAAFRPFSSGRQQRVVSRRAAEEEGAAPAAEAPQEVEDATPAAVAADAFSFNFTE